MKKILLASIFTLVSIHIKCQQANWYGLDFTVSKMIGSAGFHDTIQIKEHYFQTWNGQILKESDKYDFKRYYGAKISNFLSPVTEFNNAINVTNIVTNDDYTIDKNIVEKAVKKYAGKKEGQGLLYVVESFNKLEEKAFVWVVVFDGASGSVSYINRFEGSPDGFGIRNYWLNAIHQIMKKSGRKVGF
jgi:hypothetical protein